jgi:integrase
MGRKSKTFDSLQEAEAWLSQMVSDHASEALSGVAQALQALSVDEAFHRWQATAVLKDSVKETYQDTYGKHIGPLMGERLISEVMPTDIDHCLSRCPMNTTAVRVALVMSGLFGWADANEHVRFNPYVRSQGRRLVRLAQLQSVPLVGADICWSAQEVRTFIEGEQIDFYRDLWTVIAGTGVRRGEALGLTAKGLTESYTLISENVTVASNNRVMVEPLPKNWRRRKAYLGPSAQRILSYRAGINHRYLFSRHHESPTRPDTVSQHFTRQTRRLGLPEIGGPHGLRRTFATLADHLGVRERVVQEAMGHAPNVTQRYNKVSETELVELATRMEQLIFA